MLDEAGQMRQEQRVRMTAKALGEAFGAQQIAAPAETGQPNMHRAK